LPEIFEHNTETIIFLSCAKNVQDRLRTLENIYCTTFSDIGHILYAPKKCIDGYPFGFNGQEKVNEVAGIGNWNTAEFGEYNTRTGIRANLDPKPNPSMSPYAVFSGNPIMFSDALLDSPYVSQIKPGGAERFIGWLFTPILKPVKALEDYGKKNWYVERDSHYGPLGFKNNGWPMWKAIWGTGGAFVGGGALLYDFTLTNTLGFGLSTYNAANDVSEAAGSGNLMGNNAADIVDAGMDGSGLAKDLVTIAKTSKGAPNPLNVLGLATFILDKTLFNNDAGGSSNKKENKSNDHKAKKTEHKSSGGKSRGGSGSGGTRNKQPWNGTL
jgi:hypothetical protein